MPKTTLEFEFRGKEYSLWFTIDALKKLEKNGFSFADIDSRILTAPEELFAAAFDAKHPETPYKTRSEIYREFSEESETGDISLAEILIQMLNECVEDMKPRGNIRWKMAKG